MSAGVRAVYVKNIMKNSVLFAVICLALQQRPSEGHVTVEYQDMKNAEAPHCLDKEGSTRSLGEMWQEKGTCSRSRCLTSVADKAILQHHKCRQFEEKVNCELTKPSGELPFPDCCPKQLCKRKKTSE